MGAGRHSTVFDAEISALAHVTKKARDIYSLGNVSSPLPCLFDMSHIF